jgi:hypothetical protein
MVTSQSCRDVPSSPPARRCWHRSASPPSSPPPPRRCHRGGPGDTRGTGRDRSRAVPPVAVSSTDYAPTPAAFAVDGLAETGVRGSGWRAAAGDPQWIAVDLQAPCRVEAVTLIFEATRHGSAVQRRLHPHRRHRDPVERRGRVHDRGLPRRHRLADRAPSPTGPAAADHRPARAGDARWVRMTATRVQPPTRSASTASRCTAGRPAARPPPPAGPTGPAATGRPRPPSGRRRRHRAAGVRLGAHPRRLRRRRRPALSTGDRSTRADWLPATVPGTVLATLVEQGHLPDPVGA